MKTWFSIEITQNIILCNGLYTAVKEIKICGKIIFLIYSVNTCQFSSCCNRSSDVMVWKIMGFTTQLLRIEFPLFYCLAVWPWKTEFDPSVLWLLHLEDEYSNTYIMSLLWQSNEENKFKTSHQLLLIFVIQVKGRERAFQGYRLAFI